MPCLLVLLIVAFPRVAIVLLYLFSNYLQRVYHDMWVPLLGFLFLPVTTLVYAWLLNSHLPLVGINLFYLVMAVVVDACGMGGGEYQRRRRF